MEYSSQYKQCSDLPTYEVENVFTKNIFWCVQIILLMEKRHTRNLFYFNRISQNAPLKLIEAFNQTDIMSMHNVFITYFHEMKANFKKSNTMTWKLIKNVNEIDTHWDPSLSMAFSINVEDEMSRLEFSIPFIRDKKFINTLATQYLYLYECEFYQSEMQLFTSNLKRKVNIIPWVCVYGIIRKN